MNLDSAISHLKKAYGDIKIVDLTIADDKSYEQLNHMLESYGNAQVKKELR